MINLPFRKKKVKYDKNFHFIHEQTYFCKWIFIIQPFDLRSRLQYNEFQTQSRIISNQNNGSHEIQKTRVFHTSITNDLVRQEERDFTNQTINVMSMACGTSIIITVVVSSMCSISDLCCVYGFVDILPAYSVIMIP